MPRRLTIPALIATLGLTGAVISVATAQEEVTTKTPQGTITSFRQPPPGTVIDRPTDVLALDQRVSIDFKGGTVAEYIQSVRTAAAPKAVNILVPTEVSNVPLPAIRLQSVTLWAAWSAMEPPIRAQGNGLEVQIEALGARMGSYVSSEAVQILTNQVRNPFRMNSAPPSEVVEVISIADLVEPRPASDQPLTKVEDVLAAIDAAARVSAEAGNAVPTLKYHPSSGLLITRGAPAANALVGEVIARVRKNAAARADQQDRVKLAKDTYEQKLTECRVRIESAKNLASTTKRRLEDYQKLADGGQIPQIEVEAMKNTYADAVAQVTSATQHLEILERAGVESVLMTITPRNLSNQDIYDRLGRLERELEALRNMLVQPTPAPGQPDRPRGVR